jgi:hypothetical protein
MLYSDHGAVVAAAQPVDGLEGEDGQHLLQTGQGTRKAGPAWARSAAAKGNMAGGKDGWLAVRFQAAGKEGTGRGSCPCALACCVQLC